MKRRGWSVTTRADLPVMPKQPRRAAVDRVEAGASPAAGISSQSTSRSAASSARVWGTRGRGCNSHRLDRSAPVAQSGERQRDVLEVGGAIPPGGMPPVRPRAGRLAHIEETEVRLLHRRSWRALARRRTRHARVAREPSASLVRRRAGCDSRRGQHGAATNAPGSGFPLHRERRASGAPRGRAASRPTPTGGRPSLHRACPSRARADRRRGARAVPHEDGPEGATPSAGNWIVNRRRPPAPSRKRTGPVTGWGASPRRSVTFLPGCSSA